jgi:gliding motility-associated-like protein
MQNYARNKAAFPEGRNAGRWGSTGMQEAYRFTPSAGLSRFKKAELLLNGSVVALADTASDGKGNLQLMFPNICPPAENTEYILRVFYNSCTTAGTEVSFDETIVVKKEDLNISLQTQDPTCTEGGLITVHASGTTSPLTYSLNGGTPQTNPTFSNLPAGNYTITVNSNSGCMKTVTTALTLQDDLLLVAQPKITACEGETITPQILSNATTFQWSPSTGISDPGDAHPEIRAENNLTYTLTATKGSCQKTADLAIQVKPLPVVNAGPDKTIIQGDATVLAASVSAGSIDWSPATGLSAPTMIQPSVTPANTTTYRLTATLNGCMASDEVTVTVVPYCIKPMEAFSPNGDGINDRWLVTAGACLQKARVEVFNRYGARVYLSDDYKNDWNGTYGGKPLPDGTYYFIITYQLINDKSVSTKGNVTILR